MVRGYYKKVSVRNACLLKKIKSIKKEHPFWGYRRTWALLKDQGIIVSMKKIRGIMEQHTLPVPKNLKLKAKRTISTHKPRPTRSNQWWGIDMTKVFIAEHGWQYLVIGIDWYTKKVMGYNYGQKATTSDWLNALYRAVNLQFPDGVKGKGFRS